MLEKRTWVKFTVSGVWPKSLIVGVKHGMIPDRNQPARISSLRHANETKPLVRSAVSGKF